jgi:RNA polymerase sigma-70 factor (sigma-E family)
MVAGDAFDEFARAEHAPLVRYAYLLTADADAAQDLAQETLVRVLVKWRHVQAATSPGAYARRVMLSLFLQGQRRRWRGEVPTTEPRDVPADPGDPAGRVDDRDLIVRLLRHLPARQRAAVLLRHYEQRSEAETAAAMGCTVGTVKSLTSRGLATLRALEPAAARSGER